jgi:hypothetical protein
MLVTIRLQAVRRHSGKSAMKTVPGSQDLISAFDSCCVQGSREKQMG